MCDTMTAVNTCSLDAVQSTTESMDLSESGDQSTSQSVSGFGLWFLIIVAIFMILVMIIWLFFYLLKKVAEAAGGLSDVFVRSVLPWCIVAAGAAGAVLFAWYFFFVKLPNDQASNAAQYYVLGNDIDTSESMDQLEQDKQTASPCLFYTLQTASEPYAMVNGAVYSNKDFSAQYSPLLTGDTASKTLIQQIFGSSPEIANSISKNCNSAELRYV